MSPKHILTTITILCGVISTILALIIFASGSVIFHSGGRDHLLFKDLSLVSFDGLILNNDTSEFLVHLHWFVNSFAWDYPDAPEGIPSVGVASRGPHFGADVAKDLRKIAQEIQLPNEAYVCARPGPRAPLCKNVFFEAWRTFAVVDGLPIIGWLTWVMLLIATVLCLRTMVLEWIIVKRPYWMRCRCIFFKRWCSYPKGSRAEIEQLDDYTWDKVRLTNWCLSAAYFLLPASQARITSIIFLEYMKYIDRRLPDGVSMHTRRDNTGEMVLWVAFAVSIVGALSTAIRWRMSRKLKTWTKDQSLPRLEAGGEASSNERYTD